MKIFEVTPEQISRLEADQLVELLRRLVQSEMASNGIPLRSGAVPAQINIADGGEDGIVCWQGAPNETDFLPSRLNIFQAKKSDPGPAGMKKETWKKSSGKDGKTPELSDALKKALENSGAYIVVTSDPVVGNKRDRRLDAIKEGIKEAGHDPSVLAAIEIYDSNRLASWTSTHPSVALWLNTVLRDVHLHGFRTFDEWSEEPMIADVALQTTDEKRFWLRGADIRSWKKDDPDFEEYEAFATLNVRIAEFFGGFGRSVRVTGPSGFGKTRLANSIFAEGDAAAHESLDRRQVVYCEYEDVKDRVVNIAREIASTGSLCTLVIDDCPDQIHTRLCDIAGSSGSNLHLITLNVDTRTQGVKGNLVIELIPASTELIELIAKSVSKSISSADVSFVRELAQGFPRMAVLAAQAVDMGDQELSSVDALVHRIVWGDSKPDDEAYRSLQVLSLFTVFGAENEAAEELKNVSEFIGRTYESVFRDIVRFSERGVIRRMGDFAEVQPVPLAMRLAFEWLNSTPSGTLESLFRSLSPELQLRMAGRLRWLSWSDKVPDFADQLLSELVPDFDALNTELRSTMLDRFVHLAPNIAMAHLDSLLAGLSIDELQKLEAGRRHVVWALEKLVFPAETFEQASSLLLRLAAAENESWGNNATGQFVGLYKLQLSGTEADPERKLRVLDAGLSSEDERIRSVCMKALDSMLTTSHFSRSAGQERIGAGEALKDWRPKTYSEIFDYYRAALARLEEIALNQEDAFSGEALDSIGSNLRGLLQIGNLRDEVIDLIRRVSSQVPRWWRGVKALNESLYFDASEAKPEEKQPVLDAYHELVPDDPLEKILMFSSGWTGDFHDPEVPYARGGENDHYYAERTINEIVSTCPTEAGYFLPLLDHWLEKSHNSSGVAVGAIAKHVDNPVELITALLAQVSKGKDAQQCAGLARSTIHGANSKETPMGRVCLDEALQQEEFRAFSPSLIAAAGVDDSLMAQIIDWINQDVVAATQAMDLALGDVLAEVSPELIDRLVTVLLSKGTVGAWSAISFLAYHNFRTSELSSIDADMLKRAITHPQLFDKEQYDQMDSYHWKELAEKLIKYGHVDEEFAERLTTVIVNMVEIEEYSVQLRFDSDVQEILRQMIDVYPAVVWRSYHDKKAQASGLQVYRLGSLFRSDIGNPSEPGVLDSVPTQIMIPWLLEDRDSRIQEVLDWIRMFDGSERNATWSDEFIAFVDQHVKSPDELNPIRSRLVAGVWSGSWANKLELELDRVEQLGAFTSNTSVRIWATRLSDSLRRQIRDAQRDEANREAGYRA